MFKGYEPIRAVRLLGGPGFPAMTRHPERANQTFKEGVPLKLNSGHLDECTFSAADIVFGVSVHPASNLAADGQASQGYSEGSPPNQPSARIIPVGAWPKDGRVGVYLADGNTVFSIMLLAGQTFSPSLVGNAYGITKDATSGFWYMNTSVTTGNSVVAEIVGVDETQNDAVTGTRVYIRFLANKRVFD